MKTLFRVMLATVLLLACWGPAFSEEQTYRKVGHTFYPVDPSQAPVMPQEQIYRKVGNTFVPIEPAQVSAPATPSGQNTQTTTTPAVVTNMGTGASIADLNHRLEMAGESQRTAADWRGWELVTAIATPVTMIIMQKVGGFGPNAYINISVVGGLCYLIFDCSAIIQDHMTADALEGKLNY